MNNTQVFTDNQLKCKVWAETIRNLIFIVLAFFVLQPVIFIFLSTIFGSRILGKTAYSAMTVYYWKYTIWINRMIVITAAILFVLFVIYLLLRRVVNKNTLEAHNKNPKQNIIVSSIKNCPELYFFALTFIWITIAFLCSGNLLIQFGLNYDALNKYTFLSQGYLFYLSFAVIFATFFATTKKQKAILLELFIIDGLIVSLLAILIDKFGMSRIYAYSFEETGIFTNRNYFGYFLAINIVLPAARMYKSKNIYLQIYYAICIVINEFALFITLTRGAFLGAAMGVILVLILCPIQEKEFNIKLIIIPMILYITILILDMLGLTNAFERIGSMFGDASSEEAIDGMSSGRITIWKGIIEQIKGSPVFGVGFGNTPNPHNEFLQTAAWHGIPAGVFYVLALITTGINALKNIKKLTNTQIAALGGAFGYAVSSFFGNGLLQTIPSYIIILALCFNINLLLKGESEQNESAKATSVEPISL